MGSDCEKMDMALLLMNHFRKSKENFAPVNLADHANSKFSNDYKL